ncbi:MAG TPA: hypothetical protein VGX25_00645 [Actinophytocola sp.]|uniref:hypothetical protein n=1 Tax=Actinophytocola sp. TaxID=1872138 RepID=UPI002DDCC3BE|nr:hypothetical protein [Actinophytocola sp.]HEV2777887.1 hypothetical protein [Actinophytocola sp.]
MRGLRQTLGHQTEAFLEWLRSPHAAAWASPYAADQRLGDGGGTVQVLLRPGQVRFVLRRHGAAVPVVDDILSPDEARDWAEALESAGDGGFQDLAAALQSAADAAEAGGDR